MATEIITSIEKYGATLPVIEKRFIFGDESFPCLTYVYDALRLNLFANKEVMEACSK